MGLNTPDLNIGVSLGTHVFLMKVTIEFGFQEFRRRDGNCCRQVGVWEELKVKVQSSSRWLQRRAYLEV